MASLDNENQTIETQLNSLLTDVTALKTAADTSDTLATELIADHAVIKTLLDELTVDNDAAFADVTALRAAVVGITAKLDLDAGVTDVNYASLLDPAAITMTTIIATALATLTAANPTDVGVLGSTAGA